jgi:hypothetical protein
MARPKRQPYENLDHSQVLKTGAPLHWEEHQSGKPCPKVKGTWLWECDNPACDHAEGGSKPLYLREKCSRRGCIICSKSSDKKRGDNLMARLGGKGVGIWVFTLPRPYDALLSGPALKELEKRFRLRLEHLYMQEEAVRIGYRQIWHPSGDHCKRCGYEEKNRWAPAVSALHECSNCGAAQEAHPHLNFLIPLQGWDVRPNDHIENPKMRKLKASITPEFLDEVKNAWAEEVTRCFQAHPHLNLPPMVVRTGGEETEKRQEDIKSGAVCVANCHYQFVKQVSKSQSKKDRTETKNQLKHRMSYFARSFPAWEESFKAVLHRGRDYGILTNVSRGNTAVARKKYRESIIFVDLTLEESGGEVIESRDDKPGCMGCIIGRLSERSYQPLYKEKHGYRIAGPFYNKDSMPYMEIIPWPKIPQKTQLLSQTASCNGLQLNGRDFKTASGTCTHAPKRLGSSSGTSRSALVS